jgi:hypothetical protein
MPYIQFVLDGETSHAFVDMTEAEFAALYPQASVIVVQDDEFPEQARRAALATLKQNKPPAGQVDPIYSVAERILAGGATAAESAALQPAATAMSLSLAAYATTVVSAGRAARANRAAAMVAFDQLIVDIKASNDTATIRSLEQAAASAVASLVTVNALASTALWTPFRSTANSGTSTIVAGTGFSGTHRISRQAGTGIRGVFIKLADLGIMPTTGAALEISATVRDTDRLPATPAPTTETLSIGLLNSALAAHTADVVPVIDLLAWQPILSPAVTPGAVLTGTVTLSSGRDSIYIGGDTSNATATYRVDIEALTVRVV